MTTSDLVARERLRDKQLRPYGMQTNHGETYDPRSPEGRLIEEARHAVRTTPTADEPLPIEEVAATR